MKTKYIYLAGCLSLFSVLCSCTKMNDTQEKYLDWGEKIYAAKIDSAVVFSGINRQMIHIYYSSPRIASGKIVYNLNQDTVDFAIPEDGTGHFVLEIKDLEETEYNYLIYTYDKQGNSSLPIEATGKVYGDLYKKYLVAKKLEGIDSVGGFYIRTKGATDAVGIRVAYTNLDGKKQLRLLPVVSNQSAGLTDALPGSEFSFTTVYCPDATAVDSVDVESGAGVFPDAYRTGMQVFDSPSNADEPYGDWKGANLYDGNYNTGWHTGNDGVWPHSISLELNASFTVHRFKIFQRTGDEWAYQRSNFRKFTLLGSDQPAADGGDSGWETIGDFEVVKPEDPAAAEAEAKSGHEFTIANPKSFRYIRLRVSEDWDASLNYTHVMELELFGLPQ